MVGILASPYVWLIIAALAAILEAVSVSLITVWFVVGGIVAFFAGFFGAPLWVQLVVFLVVSLACIALLRPMIVKHRKVGSLPDTTPVGSEALVIEDIGAGGDLGRVETPDHMTWVALSQDGSRIEAGARVRIVNQDSIKLIVERM